MGAFAMGVVEMRRLTLLRMDIARIELEVTSAHSDNLARLAVRLRRLRAAERWEVRRLARLEAGRG